MTPALYATTKAFLDYFNLRSLNELPSLAQLQDIDSMPSLALAEEIGSQKMDPGEVAH